MKIRIFMSLTSFMVCLLGLATAQVKDVPQPTQPSDTNAAAAAVTTDPAKVAEFQARFAQGKELEQEGKLTDALAIFDGIIAEAPDAKGSLREAGYISVQLNDMAKANVYFEKLHELVPDYPAAIEALIQINESLKRDVKVIDLIKEYHDLYDLGKVPNPYFVRERIHLDQGLEIVFTEFFDYKKEPYTAWMAEVFDSTGDRKRWLLFNYDPDATKALAVQNASRNSGVFHMVEYILKDDKPTEIDVYQSYSLLPDYHKVRNTMLAILANTPKPVYSAPVPAQSAN